MINLLEQIFLQVSFGILAIDKDYKIVVCNNFIADYTQKKQQDMIGQSLFEIYPDLPKVWLERRISNIFLLKNSSFINWEQRPSLFNFPGSRPITGSNSNMIQNCSLLPILNEQKQVAYVCITINDVTSAAMTHTQVKRASKKLIKEKKAQQELIEKLEETKNQLLQSEKMASIGQLAAGVAHEINNPVGFIKSNFSSLKHYATELNEVIKKYEGLLADKQADKINEITDEHDLEFVTEDINNLLTESFDGISRIEEIVKSLKHFSHADTNQWEEADINQGIESTLKIVGHELKYIAELEKHYGELPLVQCLPMQVNQVFMNLLVNAAQAMDDKKNGKISITTQAQDDYITVKISDNGKGIEEKDIIKIFDPFFTTKPVGKGTGLGLSLSYNIIHEHNGDIKVESQPDKGTTFIIKLPIQQVCPLDP